MADMPRRPGLLYGHVHRDWAVNTFHIDVKDPESLEIFLNIPNIREKQSRWEKWDTTKIY